MKILKALVFILLTSNANAAVKAIMEGVPSSNSTILVSTRTGRVVTSGLRVSSSTVFVGPTTALSSSTFLNSLSVGSNSVLLYPGVTIGTGTWGPPATSGSASNGLLRIGNGTVTDTVLDIGVSASVAPIGVWMQARQDNGYNSNSDLYLNPNGAVVNVGNSLEVVGQSTFRSSVTFNGGQFILASGSTIATNGSLSISTAATVALTAVPVLFLNSGTKGQVGIGTIAPEVGAKLTIDSHSGTLAYVEFSSNTSAGGRVGIITDALNSLNDFAIGGGPGHAMTLSADNGALGTRVVVSSQGVTTGGAVCINAMRAISKCTSQPDASGNCTCP